MYTTRELCWTSDTINVLGINISSSREELNTWNCNEMALKIKNILGSWTKRGLSISGKVMVVNTLIASLFIYKMNVLPMVPEKTLKEFHTIMRDFVWKEKVPRIAADTLTLSKDRGGLKLVD